MKLFLLLVCGCLLTAGCATTNTETVNVSGSDPVAGEIVLGEKMLTAFSKNDAPAFLKYLSGDAQKNFGEKEFKATRGQIVEAMGIVKAYEYLTCLKAPGFRSHLWKVTFERGKTLNQTEKITQQTLFRIVLLDTADKKQPPHILTFGFL